MSNIENNLSEENDNSGTEDDSGSSEDSEQFSLNLPTKGFDGYRNSRIILSDASGQEDSDLGDLVADDSEDDEILVVEEGEDADKGKERGTPHKRSNEDDDDDDENDYRLEDEDYDLLEENLGVKVKRHKFKRLRRVIDSGSEEEDAVDNVDTTHRERRAESIMRSDVESQVENSSSEDDFIVDDEGNPISQRVSNVPVYYDKNLQEAREIFGVEFDYDDVHASGSEDEEVDSDDAGVEKESITSKRPRRKAKSKKLSELYEPAELEKAGITDEAQKIRKTDMPERFQLRTFPLMSTGPELNEEVVWIYVKAFGARFGESFIEDTSTIASLSEEWEEIEDLSSFEQNTTSPDIIRNCVLTKIKKVVELIRDHQYEVPFIYFYKKHLTRPEFTLYDLWKIYEMDEEYCRLYQRRERLISLFVNMQSYHDTLEADVMDMENIRAIGEDEIESIKKITEMIDLHDRQMQFMLYYSESIPNMKSMITQKEKGLTGLDELTVELSKRKNRVHRSPLGMYRSCQRNGIAKMLPLLGLTAEEFADNYEANDIVNSIHQCDLPLDDVLQEFTQPRWPDKSLIAKAAMYMLASQFSKEVKLRQAVRNVFYAKAKVCVAPTKKGFAEIDENHAVFPMRYLKGKPTEEINGVDFLELILAETNGLITITIGEYISDRKGLGISLVEEAKALFKAEDSEIPETIIEKWEELRRRIVDYTFETLLYPELRKELRHNLLQKGMKLVKQRCCDKIYTYLVDEPYKVTYDADNEEGEWDTSNGIRVMGVAFFHDSPVHVGVVNKDGTVIGNVSVSNLFTRSLQGMTGKVIQSKEADMHTLRNLIEKTKPHVIVVGGESRGAVNLVNEMRNIISTFPDFELNYRIIPVHIIDNDVAKLYSRTTLATEDFPGTAELFRQTVSLARLLQDPLLEIAQLFNRDEDILHLHLYKYQRHIPKDELRRAIEIEFINRTSETGVNLNQAIKHKHRSATLQFVPAFGFHKAAALLRNIRESEGIIKNRSELSTKYGLGDVVYRNCAGFVKIAKEDLPEDADLDPRDQTRIHPEFYDHALTVAQAAMDEETVDESDSAVELLEKVMTESHYKQTLKTDLKLTDYVEELKMSGHGDLKLVFEDIITEFLCPYEDFRKPFHLPEGEELFYILTKETSESIREKKLITGYVSGAKWRRPTTEECDEALPLKDESGKYRCKFCMKMDFRNFQEIWEHYDDKDESCPGTIEAIQVRFGNGITGLIQLQNCSDRPVTQQELMHLVKLRPAIHVRILRVNLQRFFLDCSSKTSDLQNVEFMPEKDKHYDEEAEAENLELLSIKLKQPPKCTYIRRTINHPSFHNISYREAETMLNDMDQGDVIFRPSSKGVSYLSLTWKVVPGVLQHLNIIEKHKPNDQSLGSCLSIGETEFEDLDEIIVRFVNPQAFLVREIISYKYYKAENYDDTELAVKYLTEEKEKNPNKIHYILSASRKIPGRFFLSFLPRDNVHREVLAITADGIRYRSKCFSCLLDFLDYWKKGYPTLG